MERGLAAVLAVLTAALVAACTFAYRLELDVENASSTNVPIQLIHGAHWADVPTEPRVLLTETVPARSSGYIDVERPGPGDWSLVIDGAIVTDSSEWPHENPTIDLTIKVAPDGSVTVEDT